MRPCECPFSASAAMDAFEIVYHQWIFAVMEEGKLLSSSNALEAEISFKIVQNGRRISQRMPKWLSPNDFPKELFRVFESNLFFFKTNDVRERRRESFNVPRTPGFWWRTVRRRSQWAATWLWSWFQKRDQTTYLNPICSPFLVDFWVF